MNNYILTDTDYNDIKNLIKITQKINLLYQKLYKLDIEGKKETKEYDDILKNIISLRKEEEEYYNLSFNKCMAYAHFIDNKLTDGHISTDTTDNIINLKYTREFLIRILSAYNSRIMNSKNINKLVPEEFQYLAGDEEFKKLLSDGSMIKDSIIGDTYNTFMYFLDEEINKKENKCLKNKLIKLKYYASFINRDIEKEQLNNNFDNTNELYLSSKFVKELYRLDEKMYEELNKESSLYLAVDQMKELVKITDSEFLEDNTNISAIARCCFLRSAFLHLDDETIMELNDNFHNVIEEKSYLILHSDDEIGQKMVINAFNIIKKDREKPKTLSLNK